MIRVNIYEAKTNLSKYLKRVAKGETVVLCKRNVPVAEIRPLSHNRKSPRPIGLAKGLFDIPPEFYEPLPPEVLHSFYADDR
ncbi:MAG: type II toxin-antitoxin system Phd/YefM family antitoxin [Deltaproteobacteria bacterium]|nr:MAG: type II toxin-antitoxin system Phd/YefM family antitoxin [Deltaproteobacteria bacterium]